MRDVAFRKTGAMVALAESRCLRYINDAGAKVSSLSQFRTTYAVLARVVFLRYMIAAENSSAEETCPQSGRRSPSNALSLTVDGRFFGTGVPQGSRCITHPKQRRSHHMMKLASTFWNDESGQGLAEYALLLGLIVIGVVAIITGMGTSIKTIFGKANNDLKTAVGS